MSNSKYYPIMGEAFSKEHFAHLDLSVHTSPYYQNDIPSSYQKLERYINLERINQGIKFLYGGYLEQRGIYVSDHFTKEVRDIHLGVDIWTLSGKAIYAPCDLRVHSTANNDNELDYGHTIIFECLEEDMYLLMGHLSAGSLEDMYEGKIIGRGEICAHIGAPYENGGWVPHLHLQAIRDIGDHWGDYPGVCRASEFEVYKDNGEDAIRYLNF